VYQIFDSETENHQSYKRTANPFDERNYVVLRGWMIEGGPNQAERFTGRTPDNYLRIPPEVMILVGHNIKFDLLFEMTHNNPDLAAFFKRGGKIWCTQYAEYLLRAQEKDAHMCAMDSIIESYGGKLKVDGIKDLWKAGVLTSEIDPDLLLDYLIGSEEESRKGGDITNTELIYLGQVKAAKQLGMMRAIQARMDGLACTTEMEYNGLKIAVKQAGENLKDLTAQRDTAEEELAKYTGDIPEEVGFNWGSGVHASCIIFGGTIKYQKQATYIDPNTGQNARFRVTEKWPLFDKEPYDPADCLPIDSKPGHLMRKVGDGWVHQDTFAGGAKKGDPKFKNVQSWGEEKVKYQDFFFKLDGYTTPKDEWAGKLKDGVGGKVYGTSSEVVEKLAKRGVPFLEALGRKQALDKEIGTYYVRYDPKRKMHVGMLTCVQPTDHIVHHSLNHTNTVTTRLSANNPNCQNIPRGDKSTVKNIFVSRFGDDGQMIEADYSQLEVVVQGLLSGDKNLIADLIDKVDFHCKRVALKNGITYEEALDWCKNEDHPEYAKWKAERTKCKIFSFQRAYGGGAGLIAEETGMDLEEVKDLIAKEDAEYSQIVKFNEAVQNEVERGAEVFRDPHRGFRNFRKGYWQAPTGTIYGWRSYDAPSFLRQRGVEESFKPTELKNYPVQGTGGEIVQLVLGVLWRYFTMKDNYGGKALLVNTVHDCIWVDAHKDVAEEVCRDIKKIMESVPRLLKAYFDMDCPVPFPVDVEIGDNMLDLHHAL